MSVFGISLNLIVIVILAYLIGAKYPGLAQKAGIA